MPAAAFVVLKGAAVLGEVAFQLLRIHEYRVVHRSVEVNRSVESAKSLGRFGGLVPLSRPVRPARN
jgi:hypothetical protein